jgi:hypothetical protein
MKAHLDERLLRNRLVVSKSDEPSEKHEEKFLAKLRSRFKEYVSITPHLVKVAIVTVIIFLCSMFIWYSFLRPDPSKTVIENVIEQFKKNEIH